MRKAAFIANISTCGISLFCIFIMFIVMAPFGGRPLIASYCIISEAILYNIIQVAFFCVLFAKLESKTKEFKALLAINIAILVANVITLLLCIYCLKYIPYTGSDGLRYYHVYSNGFWFATISVILSIIYFPFATKAFKKYRKEAAVIKMNCEQEIKKLDSAGDELDPVEAIRQLNKLRKSGAIDEKTYRKKCQKYIDML